MPVPPPPPAASFSFAPVNQFSKLNKAIWILFCVSAGFGILEVIFAFLRSFAAFALIENFSYDTSDAAGLLDDISSTFSALNFLIALPIFVLLIIYSFQFSKKVAAAGHKLTFPLGMSIGAWFIPLANAALGFILFLDFIKVSVATKKKNFLLLNLWWWLWIAGVHLSIVFNTAYTDTTTWDGATAVLSTLNALFSLVATGAMVCGVLFFRELRKVEMDLQPAPMQ